MKILLTGGSGFIGTEFRKQASAAGYEVDCMGGVLPDVPSIDWKRYDAVVHLAAAGVNYGSTDRTWEKCIAVNYVGLVSMLNLILASGATPSIYIPGSIRESELATVPHYWLDPYIITKKLSADFVQNFSARYQGRITRPILGRCKGPGEVQAVAERILTLLP